MNLPAALQRHPRLDRWLGFAADGTVQARSGKVELGQGILTALAQIVAEELDVPFERVRMLAAGTGHSPDEGVTSGSHSVQDSGAALRQVCAEARWLLVQEAARRWSLPPRELKVAEGRVVAPDGRRLAYAELAEPGLLAREAGGQAPHKPREQYQVVGRSVPRADLAAKLGGPGPFIHDLDLPGLLHGRILHPPHRDAQLLQCDADAAGACPGVQAWVRDGRLLGVVAESGAAAQHAIERLARGVAWSRRDDRLPDEQQLAAWLKTQPAETQLVAERTAAVPGRAAQTLRAAYAKPWIAHASLGPCCALARVDSGRLEVWTHSQGIFNLRRDLALALALPEDAVTVQHVEGAGCYGHNGADDVAFEAAWLARAVPGRPVRVLWSRADELAQAPFGPAMAIELEAGLDAEGQVLHWQHQVWSNGHSTRPGRSAGPAFLGAGLLARPFAQPVAINVPLAAGGGGERNAVPGYEFPGWRVLSHRVLAMSLRSSALRALGAFANVFAAESFMDELAEAGGHDPVAFRCRHLRDPRGRRVIERAVGRARALSSWRGGRRGEGIGHGLGYARYKGTGAYCAVVAQVEATAEVRVRRLVIAVDVGLAVNPDGVANQIEGGAVQAVSWTLKEAVRFDRERVTSDSWEAYPILRFSEVPEVDVEIVASDAPSLGAGEAAMGPTAAAIANAVYDALGVRVRELPITRERVIRAMDPDPAAAGRTAPATPAPGSAPRA